ncbi:hypothetical protein ABZV60_26475 [Streptomyces sp. NPDC004787]|uniref:hypothetical protein n=1 Tax=Streptomyces sp. NPDC004787 TaxID=3154291 RepID=UPI0033A0371E
MKKIRTGLLIGAASVIALLSSGVSHAAEPSGDTQSSTQQSACTPAVNNGSGYTVSRCAFYVTTTSNTFGYGDYVTSDKYKASVQADIGIASSDYIASHSTPYNPNGTSTSCSIQNQVFEPLRTVDDPLGGKQWTQTAQGVCTTYTRIITSS